MFQALELDDLLRDARTGTPAALDALARWLDPVVRHIAFNETPRGLWRTAAPSDIAQLSMVAVTRNMPVFRGTTGPQFMAWVRAIIRGQINSAREWERAAKRDPRLLEPLTSDPPAPGLTPSHIAVLNEEEARLYAALAGLSLDHRRVIELRDFQDLSFAEIGAAMGRSEDAVRRLHSRACQAWLSATTDEP